MPTNERVRYALVSAVTGFILRIGECEIDDLAIQADETQDVVSPVGRGIGDDTHYWGGSNFLPLPPRPSPWSVWNGKAWVDPRTAAQRAADAAKIAAGHWATLRKERDRLLGLSDWTQVADVPLTIAEKLAWQTYRRALRDLPEKTATPARPAWPTPPQT